MKLREIRKAAGWTQQELANRAGVAREVINRAEANRVQPELGTLIKLSNALGCSLDDLVGRSPADYPAENILTRSE